eukprot:m.5167 g.5167  ORF g.5167 m.5167 type:complete len:864 (-) comp3241_c0_seq1:190-2781(-)
MASDLQEPLLNEGEGTHTYEQLKTEAKPTRCNYRSWKGQCLSFASEPSIYCKRHTCSVPNCGLGCSSSDEKCAKHAQEAVVELDAYTTYLTDPPKQRQITVRRPSDEPERLPLPPRPTNVQKQEDSDYQNIRRKATAESSFGGFDDERTYDTVGDPEDFSTVSTTTKGSTMRADYFSGSNGDSQYSLLNFIFDTRGNKPKLRTVLLLNVLLYPLVLLLIGIVIDFNCYGQVFKIHAQALLAISLACSPLLCMFSLWPRELNSEVTRPRHTRAIVDVVASTVMLILLNIYVSRNLQTTSAQSYYVVQDVLQDFGSNFSTINTYEDYYNWLENDVASAIYDVPSHCQELERGYYKNGGIEVRELRMCGGFIKMDPILQQLRVKKINCGSLDFLPVHCYPPFSESHMSTNPYGRNEFDSLSDYFEKLKPELDSQSLENFSSPLPPPFHNVSQIIVQTPFYYRPSTFVGLSQRRYKNFPVLGVTRSIRYPGGGYFFQIPLAYDKQDFVAAVRQLHQENWINTATRFLALRFEIVIPGTSKSIWVSFEVEFLESGSGYVSSPITRMENDSQKDAISSTRKYWINYYTMVLAIPIFLALTFPMRFFEFGLDIFRNEAYCTHFVFELSIFILVLASYACRLSATAQYPSSNQGEAEFMFKGKRFGILEAITPTDLSNHTALEVWSQDLIACAIIVAWFRMLQYITWIPFVGTVPRAMLRAFPTVAMVVLTLAIMSAGFVVGFYTIYSAEEQAFVSKPQTFITLWYALLGDLSWDNFNSHYELGLVLFVLFSFLLVFVFLTMFVAVIGEAYNNTVEQEAKQYEIFSASGVKYSVRKHMSAWFHFSIEGYMDCNGQSKSIKSQSSEYSSLHK